MKLETGILYLNALRALASRNHTDTPARPDTLQASEIPSVRSEGLSDRVLADIDQDGVAFARHAQDKVLFDTRKDFLPRKRCTLQVILSGGKVCLRKRFPLRLTHGPKAFILDLFGMHFLTELAALKRLEGCASVPRLIKADLFRRTIYMEFIAGRNLRHVIGALHPVLDLAMRADPVLRRLSPTERTEREFALCAATLPEALRRDVLAAYQLIHAWGVIVCDLHPANIVVGGRTGQPYLVDFESALLGPAASRIRAERCQCELTQKLKLGPVCGGHAPAHSELE